MKDWKRTPVPKTLEALHDKVDRLVDSLPDFQFLDGVTLTNAPAGDLVAHGGRSVPKRIFVELDNANSGAYPEVGDKTSTHVRLYSFDDRTVNLMIVF